MSLWPSTARQIKNASELRTRRLQLGLSTEKLAALAGLTRRTIILIEAGTYNPRPETLARIEGAIDKAKTPLRVEDVERSGKWIAHHNYNRHRIDYWLKLGLLDKQRHSRNVKVLLSRRKQGDLTKVVVFWRVSKLRSLEKIDWAESRRKKCKAYRLANETKVIGGVEHLRAGPAAQRLGLTKNGLRESSIDRTTAKVAGRETGYYALHALQDAKRRRENLDKPKPGQVDLQEAAVITHRSTWTLLDEEWCKDNGIHQDKRIGYRKGRGKKVAYWFDKKELIEYRDRPRFPLPPGRMTATDAAEKLGVTPGTVRLLCRLEILQAMRGTVARGWTMRDDGWLIDTESVALIWEILSRHFPNKIKGGWALRAAKAEAMPGAESKRAPGMPGHVEPPVQEIVLREEARLTNQLLEKISDGLDSEGRRGDQRHRELVALLKKLHEAILAQKSGGAGDLTKVEQAIQIFLRDTNQSIRKVAEEARCDHALLSRSDKFQRVIRTFRGELPKGSKTNGVIEALDPGEPED